MRKWLLPHYTSIKTIEQLECLLAIATLFLTDPSIGVEGEKVQEMILQLKRKVMRYFVFFKQSTACTEDRVAEGFRRIICRISAKDICTVT